MFRSREMLVNIFGPNIVYENFVLFIISLFNVNHSSIFRSSRVIKSESLVRLSDAKIKFVSTANKTKLRKTIRWEDRLCKLRTIEAQVWILGEPRMKHF